MSIELPREARKEALASIERYFLEKLAPLVYNQAVADVQDRLQARIAELSIGLMIRVALSAPSRRRLLLENPGAISLS